MRTSRKPINRTSNNKVTCVRKPRRARQTQGDRALATIRAIVASLYCREYLVGYTSGPSRKRFVEHRQYGYRYIAVVADGMTCKEALDLELALQRRIKGESERSILWRKYEPKARADYSRRAGNPRGDDGTEGHSVYVVWR